MRTRRTTTIEDLRRAISCLPRHTRVAMLEGVRSNPIIVGAYTGEDGICPMLAAHRAGGRTDFASFARAWDRFAFRDTKRARARRATERELRVLVAHLEASLIEDEGGACDFRATIADHVKLTAARPPERTVARRGAAGARRRPGDPRPGDPRPGDPDRSKQLRGRPGWAWMRVVRRLDDYERVLALLEEQAPLAQRDLVAGRDSGA